MFNLLRKAPARFLKSFGYCWDGLRSTFWKEESFRLETIAGVLLAAILAACPWPWWKRVAMMAVYLLIPMTEILNSAIENVCDLVTTERSPLVKDAKDKGALAVLAAIVINAFALTALILI